MLTLDIVKFQTNKLSLALFLVGLNLRLENPLLNLRIKTLVEKYSAFCFTVGGNYYSSFDTKQLG